jgi:hypothetical protein
MLMPAGGRLVLGGEFLAVFPLEADDPPPFELVRPLGVGWCDEMVRSSAGRLGAPYWFVDP